MIVFLVIWHDRHADDVITVHATRESADERIADVKRRYDGETWVDEMTPAMERACWLAYSSCSGDNPTLRIERKELQT